MSKIRIVIVHNKIYYAAPEIDSDQCNGCAFNNPGAGCLEAINQEDCCSTDTRKGNIWRAEKPHLLNKKDEVVQNEAPRQSLINHILWAMAGGIITDEEGIWLYRLRGIDSMGYCCGWIALLDGINCENTTLHIAEARMATEQECRRGGASYLPDTEKRAKQKTSEPSDDPRATFFYPMDARIIHDYY